MARKNSQKSAENSGAIVFDSRTKAVMAQVTQDNVKEKVHAIKEVVPEKSPNEIILVLQYYDYCVERTIQAYLDDGAQEALNEWHYPGNKVPSKKNKNKKKAASNQSSQNQSADQSSSLASQKPVLTNHSEVKLPNNLLVNGHGPEPNKTQNVSSASTEESAGAASLDISIIKHKQGGREAVPDFSSSHSEPLHRHAHNRAHEGHATTLHDSKYEKHEAKSSHGKNAGSEQKNTSSSVSSVAIRSKKPHAGLEKSIKDLHRQTVSLERLKMVLGEEVEKAYKRIKSVFEEMRTCLNEREAQIVREMDQLKVVAFDTITLRKEKAAELKVKIDRAQGMTESERFELRADIKNFVGDRKIDEDLGRTTRFLYDSDHLRKELETFAEIVPVKSVYSTRRPSVLCTSSNPTNHEEPMQSPVSTNNTSMQSAGSQEVVNVHEVADQFKTSLQIQGQPLSSSDIQIKTTTTLNHDTWKNQNARRQPRRNYPEVGRDYNYGQQNNYRYLGRGLVNQQNLRGSYQGRGNRGGYRGQRSRPFRGKPLNTPPILSNRHAVISVSADVEKN